MNQQLDGDNFDVCRICLRQPKKNGSIVFLDIFKPLNDGKTLKEYIKDLFDLNVEPNDQKPRKICEVCYISMVNIKETKQKAAESAIIINHLTSKKSNGTTFHGQFVCSNSDLLKVFTSNKDATIKNNSKCMQKISNLESSHYDLLNGSDATDPSEPLYCLCDQIAFGNMIACDHKACVTEWFHYDCVGIMKPPRGKWYCPKCRSKIEQLTKLKKKQRKTL